ncbi:LLM class flavin-dependent oxidoreductase [Flavobacterium supellecticarium]|uniref:Luciferase-like monooxygenase n=1 Tax=Flavobacterium supellecticarium TaxID=2565924 RepID=A0A4S3ZUM6_9FLAO|nr:LLM class flavin-dependent oxidoreductase [Flavobacterium supellecticarium]THF49400.1 LLM class flavin-dependent oxidoreductase [Flavobacterium supellecticarium]
MISTENPLHGVHYSILDLAVVSQGDTYSDTFRKCRELAQKVEALGYSRFWLSEHHNMQHVASSATSVLIGNIAEHTQTLRIGSGGIMLPNHSPLAVAEQFGTLSTLYPGRIDLGLGRAPGTDGATAMALRKNNYDLNYDFEAHIQELQRYLSAENSTAKVRAFPGEGIDIPLWILGSSMESAILAGKLGLPYAFAAHFAPAQFYRAIELYRHYFIPSEYLAEPYILACVNVVAADNDDEANYLATSLYQAFTGIITNTRRPLMPPVDDMDDVWTADVMEAVMQMTAFTFVGNKTTLQQHFAAFIEATKVDEIMAISQIFDHKAKLRSFEILAEVFQK